jgi:rifampicin phosphotransferase
MDNDLWRLDQIDRTHGAFVGGKAARLGELTHLEGIRVPPGFCVTVPVFEQARRLVPRFDEQLDQLSRLGPEDGAAVRTLSAEIRRGIEVLTIPDELVSAVTRSVERIDGGAAYAVRSSATAEDLVGTSFAGQYDTYLNVVGIPAILEHVRRCWASLFNERAVLSRMRHGLDHREAAMAVVVQRMVVADAAGVLFTADPLTSNRKVVSVEATLGLGEALVAGSVNADVYRVRDGAVDSKAIATKQLAIRPGPGGGTVAATIGQEAQRRPALSDEQVASLARLGRRIEAHFGYPQDVEWCLVGGAFWFVQTRPVTTLFPLPPGADDGGNHVYVSVGHQQMMTDAMRPLGLSLWQLTTRRPMVEAGGRLFVDVASDLGSPTTRRPMLRVMGRSDPLIGDALESLLERGDFIPALPAESGAHEPSTTTGAGPIEADPAIVTDLIARSKTSIATLRSAIWSVEGGALFDFIRTDLGELREVLFSPQSHQAIMAGMEAAWWLNDHFDAWLGEHNAVDTLTQSVPHNVTADMGRALLDVADDIRPHPEVVEFLAQVEDDDFLARLVAVEGGQQARRSIDGFLEHYGMRCAGEIDITRPRWSERPTALLPTILGNVENFEPGAACAHFEQCLRESAEAASELLARLRRLPGGETKAEQAEAMIEQVRAFSGYREYPKYAMVSRYFIYKQALLAEAERLVAAGTLRSPEDIFYLRFEELERLARADRGVLDVTDLDLIDLIDQRRAAFRSYRSLTPPRVFTSDGEVVSGSYRRDGMPAGALVGLPVSAGAVEGRARVMEHMAEGALRPGDVLVTAYTDPSWTPAFLTIAGLVTEVGGLMTHGAVIAREYGLPAVVGVERATHLIRDGQRIRVDGTAGYVEIC